MRQVARDRFGEPLPKPLAKGGSVKPRSHVEEKAQKIPNSLLSGQVAEARRIIDAKQACLRTSRRRYPTHEAEGALRTYASSLMHLLVHEQKLKEEARAQKSETKLKGGHPKAI
jgi:hypothetical protein